MLVFAICELNARFEQIAFAIWKQSGGSAADGPGCGPGRCPRGLPAALQSPSPRDAMARAMAAHKAVMRAVPCSRRGT